MEKNKKVITCAPIPPPHGGIANWYRIVCDEAERNGYTLLNINTSPKKSINGRSIFYRIFVQGFRMLKQYGELRRLVKNHSDANVAHIATSGSLALIRDVLFLDYLKKKNIKTIYHIHYGRIPKIFQRKSFEYYFISKALALSSEIIAIDPQTYQRLTQAYVLKKIHYIPNPVKSVEYDRCKYEFPKTNIVFLGNVIREKGVEELLTAWKSLSIKHPEWKLIMAGYCEADYKLYLEKNYSFNNVIMLGYIPHDDAIKILLDSAFLVLPSYTEGFPNVVLEAMMCNKAVIATDVGAISDILSSQCGIIVKPRDSNCLEKEMERLINDSCLRNKMGNNGWEKVVSCYQSDVVFSQYEQLWGN